MKNSLYKKVVETKAVENTIVIKDSLYKESYLDYLKGDDRVSKAVEEKTVCIPAGELEYDDGQSKGAFLFVDEETNKSFEQVKIEKSNESMEHTIYAPIYLENYGFRMGDSLDIIYNNNTYSFHVGGFYETTIYGVINSGALKFIGTEETMKYLQEELGTATMIGVNCYDVKDCQAVHTEFMTMAMNEARTGSSFNTIMDISFDDNDESYSFITTLISFLLTAFSIVIVILVLLVIRVRISNHIEDNLTNIGTMGAIGYTKSQIQVIYIYEYLISAFTAAVLGTLAAYGATPFIHQIFQMVSGMTYENSFVPVIDVCCLGGILLCVTFMSLQSSRKVKNYPPVVAFHKGRKSHDFKKNHFDICTEHGNLHVKIAEKSILAALKQHILIILCIAGVSFVAVFGAIMYSSFVSNSDTLKKITGMEIADIGIEVESSTDATAVMEHVDEIEGIDHTLTYDVEQVLINDNKLMAYICGDYTKVRTISCYEGSFPQNEDEVVITGVLAEKLGKKVGDTVDINQGGYTASYMITGLTQTMTYSGQILYMTSEGIMLIKPTFEPTNIYVYLENGRKIEDMISQIKELFGSTVTEITMDGVEPENTDKYARLKKAAENKIKVLMSNYGVKDVDYSLYIDGVTISGSSKSYAIKQMENIWKSKMATVAVLQDAIRFLMSAIILAIVFIIILILSLVIRTMIIHRKEEFGIFKAIGYTSAQLRVQIAVSMVPSVLFGTLLGSIVAYILVNPLASTLFHTTGISSVQMAINPAIIVTIDLVITGFSFAIAMLIAGKVKKITVYDLLKE